MADDNKGILFLLEMITKRSGYRVESFADGASALKEIQRLAAQGETPALLVTDNEMPEMSGIKLLQNLGHHGISMPTVFLSGNINDDVQRQVSKICPHVVIRQKPLNMAHEVFLEATKQFNEASFSPSEIVESQQRQGSSEQQQGSRPGR